MSRFIQWLKCLVIDPLGVRLVLNTMNAKAAMLQGDILHQTKRTEELMIAFHDFSKRMKEYELLVQVKLALDATAPDMFWVKDAEGKYIIANKAIRDNLLFDDSPYGKDDRELAEAVKAKVGADNHTFGAICGNSDKETLKQDRPMKFNEDGLVNGKYTMLQVHKNVVRDKKGEVIAVVGGGRDITYEVETINDIIATTTDANTKTRLVELLDHYKFTDRD